VSDHHIVNDVTQLNPVRVMAIVAPETVEEVQEALRRTTGTVSVGGGRFSMGGQTASSGSVHFDMRRLNRIVRFSPEQRTIRVQAGVRWCDIQRFIDPHGLAVKIMQTYANFTVGGALSVNCHGRYVGLGPLVLSVRSLLVALHDGSTREVNRTSNPELFYGIVGGYGALGIVLEVELDLSENKRVLRTDSTMPLGKYWQHFATTVRNNPAVVFHNADLYAPHYKSVRAVSWVETEKPATTPSRLQPLRKSYPLHQYFLWAVSETPLGKERREKIIDPILYMRKKVHWRNYEAGYDAAELEPPSRMHRTYVLQEYFVPVERLEEFVPKMAEILQRHRVNAINISIRHAMPDEHTLLNWAPVETFAFVLYYKQRTRDSAKARVAVWTRELIDAAISVGGKYYLPYQPHARHDQFHRAYPRASQLFDLKRNVDPYGRFTNALWDKYFHRSKQPEQTTVQTGSGSEFHQVFGSIQASDAFYLFLQNVFHTLPEDRFHHLISQACEGQKDDKSIYLRIQAEIKNIKPALADLTYALPALWKQKGEMTSQTIRLLENRREIRGYAEIGSKGRYFKGLGKQLNIAGPTFFVDDHPQTFSPVDVMERGQVSKLGTHVNLDNYSAWSESVVPSASLDLITCYIGLHHISLERLEPFLQSIHRALRPGGVFILRDHDVTGEDMRVLVSLAHTVFNAGLGESWETNCSELRLFESVETWVARLKAVGLVDSGQRILQDNDPTQNVLMSFVKSA